MIHQQLDIPGALRLDAKKLRKIACELVHPHAEVRRLDDEKALRMMLGPHPLLESQTFNLVSSALTLAREYETDLDLNFDLSEDQHGRVLLNESYWRRIVARLKMQPWAFILNYANNQASARHEDVHGVSYGFDDSVTTWKGIVAAGPGSVVVFYNTSNAPKSPMSFSAIATVREIEERPKSEDGRRVWRAHLENFHDITPVIHSQVNIPNRNHQHGIQAISWRSYQDIVKLGRSSSYAENQFTQTIRDSREIRLPDLSESLIARRAPELVIPESHDIELGESPLVDYSPSVERVSARSSLAASRDNRTLDKLTETRAVEIAIGYMALKGWVLKHDRQRDGVGYDLEFQRGNRELFVEVKGIRGTEVTFNMTVKEWHQCLHRPGFLVIAITRVLENDEFDIHLLWPRDLCKLERQATQFRLRST